MTALKISNIVYGRQNVRNRVFYRLHTLDGPDTYGIPETVVLNRWRCRVRQNYRFCGHRLSPNVWKGVAVAFGTDVQTVCHLGLEDIQYVLDHMRDLLRTLHFKMPSAVALKALFGVVGPERLAQILCRHTSPDREGRYGIPDLFLYSVEQVTGRYADAHFIEVKRPGEQVRSDQTEEMEFLRSLGLHARVLRLIER